jgi:hypothetical protein
MREEGYYFIKQYDNENEWEPAKWDGEYWHIIAWENSVMERDIFKIDERKIARQPENL